MKKYVSDLRVVSVEHINDKYVLVKLTQDERLPEVFPGQFVEGRFRLILLIMTTISYGCSLRP